MSAPELVVFGCLTLDNVVTAEGVCLPQSFGGNCLYAALGARLWCERVGIVSRCGGDYPGAVFELLRETGIDASGVTRLERPHGRNVAFAYRADGSRTRAIPPEVLARMPVEERPRFVDTTLLPEADAKWLDFSPGASDMPAAWWDSVRGVHDAYMPVERHGEIAAAIRARPNRGIWMQIDSPWHDRKRPDLDDAIELFRNVQAVLPSEADIEDFQPGVGYEETVEEMLRMGARLIAVKRGAAGSAVFARDKGLIAKIRALEVVVVDPTGAGDAFCGGFLAGLLASGDPVMAARYGTVSASFAVEAAGLGRLAHADPSEARARLATLAVS